MEDIPLSVLIPIQILFIALNAFLSVLEASIQSLSDGRVRKLAEEGDKDAIDTLSIGYCFFGRIYVIIKLIFKERLYKQ